MHPAIKKISFKPAAPTKEHEGYGYECPVTFISDRDDPLTAESISTWFEEMTGRQPTADELREMHPDTPKAVADQAAWYGDYNPEGRGR